MSSPTNSSPSGSCATIAGAVASPTSSSTTPPNGIFKVCEKQSNGDYEFIVASSNGFFSCPFCTEFTNKPTKDAVKKHFKSCGSFRCSVHKFVTFPNKNHAAVREFYTEQGELKNFFSDLNPHTATHGKCPYCNTTLKLTNNAETHFGSCKQLANRIGKLQAIVEEEIRKKTTDLVFFELLNSRPATTANKDPPETPEKGHVTNVTTASKKFRDPIFDQGIGKWRCPYCPRTYESERTTEQHYGHCSNLAPAVYEKEELLKKIEKCNLRHIDALEPGEIDLATIQESFKNNPVRSSCNRIIVHESSFQFIFRSSSSVSHLDAVPIVKRIAELGFSCSILINTGIHGAPDGRFYTNVINDDVSESAHHGTMRFFNEDLKTLATIGDSNINFALNPISTNSPPCYTDRANIVIDLWCYSDNFTNFWELHPSEVFTLTRLLLSRASLWPLDETSRPAKCNYPIDRDDNPFIFKIDENTCFNEKENLLHRDLADRVRKHPHAASNAIDAALCEFLNPSSNRGDVGTCQLEFPSKVSISTSIGHTHTDRKVSGGVPDNQTCTIFFNEFQTKDGRYREFLGYGEHLAFNDQSAKTKNSYKVCAHVPYISDIQGKGKGKAIKTQLIVEGRVLSDGLLTGAPSSAKDTGASSTNDILSKFEEDADAAQPETDYNKMLREYNQEFAKKKKNPKSDS